MLFSNLVRFVAASRPVVTPLQLSWSVAFLLALLYNTPLWHLVLSLDYGSTGHKWLFAGAFVLFIVAVIQCALSALSWPLLVRPLLIALLLSAALANYFMESYGILFDKSMIQNMFETDPAEVADLLAMPLWLHLAWKGVLPTLLVLWVRLKPQSLGRLIAGQSISLLTCLVLIGSNAALLYKDYSSLFRNHREIRNLAIPSSYLYYTGRYFSGAYSASTHPFEPVGEDAIRRVAQVRPVSSAPARPDLLVLVVGETARSMNFGLNGYTRPTTPELSHKPVVSFRNVESCGTSTAVSLPCMFSLMTRQSYDEDSVTYQGNVLDILQQAGLTVEWIENSSGCKGVCDRIKTLSLPSQQENCGTEGCFDMELLNELERQLEGVDDSAVIVLHQMGSHGPAYYKRVPETFEYFTPICRDSQLQLCSRESITNAYDNSLRYTDHLLARVIDLLQEQSRFNTAMVYLSDHGESLGENNLYLHGMPWLFAPDEQKQVPLIVWLSDSFQQRYQLSAECLQAQRERELSHDNLPHSLLGLMSVRTEVYNAELDLFAGCREANQARVVHSSGSSAEAEI